MDSKDLRNLSEAWDNIVSTKEEVEQIDEATGLTIGPGGFNIGGKPVKSGPSPIFKRPSTTPPPKGVTVGPGGFNVGGKPVQPGLSPIFQRPGQPAPTRPAATAPTRPAATAPRPAATAPRPASSPATTKTKPEAPKPLGFTPRTLTSAELKAATAARAAARSAGKSAADVEKDAIAAVSKLQKSSFDIFDVIKGHLLDEGYADTEEAALVIMANMSESWKKSIIEG